MQWDVKTNKYAQDNTVIQEKNGSHLQSQTNK